MKVIVAGFPKTGTKSMNWALTKLGYKVYDFPENVYLLREDYKKIFTDGWTTEDFRRMYEHADAVVDCPPCLFWEEIHKAFPDAKIILTMRENEDEWFQSMQKMIDAVDGNIAFQLLEILSPTQRRTNRDVMDKMATQMGWSKQPIFSRKTRVNAPMMKLKYRAHNAYVLHAAPKDKLLVFKCSEGWEPLCKFLGVPVPDVPFPHKNKAGNVVKEAMAKDPVFQRMKNEVMFSSGLILAGITTIGYYTYKLGPTALCKSIFDFAKGLFQTLQRM